jgi:predicted Zn-dependent protease
MQNIMKIFVQLRLVFVFISVACLILTSCSTVPVTGRQQLNIISSAQEVELGLSSFEKLKKDSKICTDPNINALVQKVGQRIAAVADLPSAQWEFVVFENAEPNAFCLPGGKVGVYTGILPFTKDEAGLATVIAHEVAHAAAHHGGERLSQAILLGVAGQGISSTMAKSDPRWQALVSIVYGAGSQLAIVLPHSRKQELEADEIGLVYMARAGYDPNAAIQFWERFSEYGKKSSASMPWFLRTHPVDEIRIQNLKAWLPRALQEYHPQ